MMAGVVRSSEQCPKLLSERAEEDAKVSEVSLCLFQLRLAAPLDGVFSACCFVFNCGEPRQPLGFSDVL